MTTNVPPSRDPANDDSLIGYTRELRRWLFKNMDTGLPAEVISHDRATNRVRVRPLIDQVDSERNPRQRAIIPSIPVLNLGGGGFLINFNLPAGQMGMIFALDRDVSLFLQKQSQSVPNTERMHSFEDAIFIPQQWFDYTIATEDSAAMVIQSLDGSVKIALDNDSIRLVKDSVTTTLTTDSIAMSAPNDISLSAATISLTSTGATTITATGGANINGVMIDAAGAVVAPTTVTAGTSIGAPTLTAATSLTVAGTEQADHTHEAGTLLDGQDDPVTGRTGVV